MTALRLPTFAFDEKEHPRGKPGNAGQFAPKENTTKRKTKHFEPDKYIEQSWPHPLHGVRDENKVQRLMEDMTSHGWVGRPLLVVESQNQALTGTHRLEAVKRLEKQDIYIPVPVINVDQDKLEAWAEETGGDVEMLRTSDDDMRESMLKEMGDKRAVRLMREEIESNDFSALTLPVDESELVPMRAYGALPLPEFAGENMSRSERADYDRRRQDIISHNRSARMRGGQTKGVPPALSKVVVVQLEGADGYIGTYPVGTTVAEAIEVAKASGEKGPYRHKMVQPMNYEALPLPTFAAGTSEDPIKLPGTMEAAKINGAWYTRDKTSGWAMARDWLRASQDMADELEEYSKTHSASSFAALPHEASDDLATVGLWKEVKAKAATDAMRDMFENLMLQRVQDGWAPPTAKQAKDGSYKKGRRKFAGLNVVVENPAGTVRMGVDPDGKPWKTKMFCDYGYISKAKGADGEGVDVYLGPNEKAADAFVVHQVDPKTGEPDEDKVMLGFDSVRDAKAAYLLHYDKPDYFGSITPVPMDEFMDKVGFGKKAKYGKVEFSADYSVAKSLPREKMAQAVYLLALNNPHIPSDASVKKSPEAYAERWMPSDTFELRLVPLEQIDWQGSMGPGSVVPDDYGNVKGPIIIEENKYNVGGINGTSEQAPRVVVLEGQKRLSDARKRGQDSILAWVGSSLGPMGEVAPQGNVVRPGGNQALLEPVGLPVGGP